MIRLLVICKVLSIAEMTQMLQTFLDHKKNNLVFTMILNDWCEIKIENRIKQFWLTFEPQF